MARMIPAVLALALASVSVTSGDARGLLQHTGKFRSHGGVNHRYIVVLNEGVHGEFVRAIAEELGNRHRGRMRHLFQRAIKGFAVELSPSEAKRLSADSRVVLVEEDMRAAASALQSNVDWGLDRIDQRPASGNGTYAYDADGSGVHLYIIDSGVRRTHTEFAPIGRAKIDFAIYTSEPPVDDCFGHGTAVASLAAGVTTGVAKSAQIHSVGVLNCQGTGYWSDVIRGIDWVTANHVKPAVANMSIVGTSKSASVKTAIEGAIDAGVTFVAAAGNSNTDACTQTPGFIDRALIVGNTDRDDVRYVTSNYGTCVDVYAPGTDIRVAFHGGNSDYRYMTGTSLAAPYVSGAAALYLQRTPDALPMEVAEAVVNTATTFSTDGGEASMLYAPSLGDRTPPTVALTAPAAGASVSGGVEVVATAKDNLGVSSIDFYVGGTLIGTDTTAPYSVRWVTDSITEGTYSLRAEAVDVGGNVTRSAARSVTVTRSTPATTRNAFAPIEAEGYDGMSGIQRSATYIGYVDGGDWVKFSAVDFGSGASSVTTRIAVAPAYAGRQVQFRLGSRTGTLIGSLTVKSTGGWYTFANQTTTIASVNGVHDLYVVGSGGAGVGNIDRFTFSADQVTSGSQTGELAANGWTASASMAYSPASRAIDRNASYKWQNGRSQAASNDYIQVDLGGARTFNRIILEHTGNSNDYPVAYRVDVSHDGVQWTTAATGSGTPTVTRITLSNTQTRRFIRVTETGNTGNYWFSVNEVRVLYQ
jgi:hypothetical protein